MPFTNSPSERVPSAHHPALVLTHDGTPSDVSEDMLVGATAIIPPVIKNSMPEINSDSDKLPSAHHPALVLTHDGTSA
jgi:hypothetical protein